MRDRSHQLKKIKMGQWNTLHVFDDKKFYQEIIPKLEKDDEFLSKYITSNVAQLFSKRVEKVEEQIVNLRNLIKQFDKDFKNYSGNENQIPNDLNKLIEIIIFSECAIFSPYFKLGYRLVSYSIEYKKYGTLAEEIISNLINGVESNLFSKNEFGIKNWVTAEELELVILDLENLSPKKDYKIYFDEFVYFLKETNRNKLGLICCIEPREEMYCYVNNVENNLSSFKEKMNLNNHIEIECSKKNKN